MKRLLLVLFAGLLLNIHVFAQFDTNDYEYYDDAEYAEEPVTNAPTNITVNNTGAEDQTEQKLTLPNSQPIYLYFYNSVQNPNPPEQAPPEPKAEQKPPADPEPIIEYRYLPAPVPAPPPPPPEPTPPPPPPPPPQVEYRYIQPPPVEYIYLPSPQVEYIYVQPPAPEPVYIQPPLQIRVIPGLPDPNSPKIYRIQVGSYAVHNTADIMAQRIRSTGLQVDTEYYNSLKRVSVPGVRAADVCTILQMLESLGFAEVWIRE